MLVVVLKEGMQRLYVMLLATNSCASETEDSLVLYVAIVLVIRNLTNQLCRQGLRRELHLYEQGRGNMAKDMAADMLVRR